MIKIDVNADFISLLSKSNNHLSLLSNQELKAIKINFCIEINFLKFKRI